MELKTLYEYYERQDIAPTFADLRDEASIAAYQTMREGLLTRRLALPLPLFAGAEILEYGPDTGENAVVFARLGAHVTLVEPATARHPRIRAYFERFAPSGSLRELAGDDVLGYAPQRRFDLVVAEGFIYTVQPTAAWLARFAGALVRGGLALVSYYERTGSLFELSLRVPFAAVRRRDGGDRVTTAEALYRPKWDRVPHTRAFASWAMDVLDNPFVRLRYFLDAASFAAEAGEHGLELHASWPSYLDGLENAWAKQPAAPAERLDRIRAHCARSALTFALGRKAYLAEADEAHRIGALLDAALRDTDALVDADDAATSARLAATLRELGDAARAARTIVDDRDAFVAATRAFDAWAAVHAELAAGRADGAVRRLREDPVLLDTWGSPAHLAVLRLAV